MLTRKYIMGSVRFDMLRDKSGDYYEPVYVDRNISRKIVESYVGSDGDVRIRRVNGLEEIGV